MSSNEWLSYIMVTYNILQLDMKPNYINVYQGGHKTGKPGEIAWKNEKEPGIFVVI